MNKLTVKDVDVAGKKVLLRVDFNVPLTMKAKAIITDDARIRAALPTIRALIKRGAAVIVMSHLGRPGGKVDASLSMLPIAERLAELLQQPVILSKDVVGESAVGMAGKLQPGEILLLENLRFHSGEKKNSPEFASALAALGDVFVNDAFGAVHRAHASVVGLAAHMPAAAGLLLAREIDYFSMLQENPQRPYFAVIGGAKVHDKIGILRKLIEKVDGLLIGGAMAYTFLKVQGECIGASLLDEDGLEMAADILARANERNIPLALPIDHVVAERFAPDSPFQVCETIPEGWMALDIGPETALRYQTMLRTAKTVIMNGPMGVFEWDNFSSGTRAVAESIAQVPCSVIGGGDSAAALKCFGLEDEVGHVSTGGGASLEFLEGKILPGIDALTDRS